MWLFWFSGEEKNEGKKNIFWSWTLICIWGGVGGTIARHVWLIRSPDGRIGALRLLLLVVGRNGADGDVGLSVGVAGVLRRVGEAVKGADVGPVQRLQQVVLSVHVARRQPVVRCLGVERRSRLRVVDGVVLVTVRVHDRLVHRVRRRHPDAHAARLVRRWRSAVIARWVAQQCVCRRRRPVSKSTWKSLVFFIQINSR